MNEVFEFRIAEEHAHLLFGKHEGRLLGDSIRLVEIGASDPRFGRIGALQQRLLESQQGLFYTSWNVKRSYSPAEVQRAELFSVELTSVFEPAGESCGTIYDNGKACASCGAGAPQSSPLLLDLKHAPKHKDIARTIAGEIVATERFLAVCCNGDLAGAAFRLLEVGGRLKRRRPVWYQLTTTSKCVVVAPRTKVGISPFDDDPEGRYRCPQGDTLGLNLLSELFIERSTYDGADFLTTCQYFGSRRGVLRPERRILISKKAHDLLTSQGVKGIRYEIAHLT